MTSDENPKLFSSERLNIIAVLEPILQGTTAWLRRYEVEVYIWRCIDAGFCSTNDQVRLYAERYIVGKRKVTPPGTERRLKAERTRKEVLSKIPPELQAAIKKILVEQNKAVAMYKSGLEKALNSLVGAVMKQYKADPAIVKELLVRGIHYSNE